MIPAFSEYFYPFLHILETGEALKVQVISQKIAIFWGLSAEQKREKTRGGNNRHLSRINYAKVYLHKMGLIELVKKGYYKITPYGEIILTKYGDKFNLSILRDLDGYENLQRNASTGKTHWVPGHHRTDGTYIPGYTSNFFAQGLRIKKQ